MCGTELTQPSRISLVNAMRTWWSLYHSCLCLLDCLDTVSCYIFAPDVDLTLVELISDHCVYYCVYYCVTAVRRRRWCVEKWCWTAVSLHVLHCASSAVPQHWRLGSSGLSVFLPQFRGTVVIGLKYQTYTVSLLSLLILVFSYTSQLTSSLTARVSKCLFCRVW